MMESLFVRFFRVEVLLINLKVIAAENYFPVLLIAPGRIYKYADYAVITRLAEKVNDDTVGGNPFECDSLMNKAAQLSLQFFEGHSFEVIQTSAIPLQFIVDQIFVAIPLPDHLNFAAFLNHYRRRKRRTMDARFLRHCIRAGVEHGDQLADLYVGWQQPAIGQAALAVQVEVNVAPVAERPGHPVARHGRFGCARGVNRVVIPVVHDHREHQVVPGVGERPILAGFGTVFDVANLGEDRDGVGDDRAARLHHDLQVVAQVIDGNAPADVDVLQFVSGLPMQPEQVIPHRRQGLDVRFGIGRLRAYVNVQPDEVDQVGALQSLNHHLAGVGRRDAELRRVERRLQSRVRARADASDKADRRVGAFTRFLRDLFDQLKLEWRIDVDRIYAGVNRLGDLAFGLRDPVHLDLLGPESRAQGAKQFAAGIDLHIDARVAHDAQHAERVVGLRRVAELDLFVMASGFEQPRDVVSNARRRDDEQRRVELFRQFDGVNPVDAEAVVPNFQVAGNRPGRLGRRKNVCH